MTIAEGDPRYRIGQVADELGITPRTIRYYEEFGLLHSSPPRAKGKHRLYTSADIARLRELIRLRNLLGLSLEELVALAEAEEARAALRDQWMEDTSAENRATVVRAAIRLAERQLELVRLRQQTLADFAAELEEKLASMRQRWKEFAAEPRSAAKKKRS